MPLAQFTTIPQALALDAYTVVRGRFLENGNPVHVHSPSFEIYEKENNTKIENIVYHYAPRTNYPDIGFVQVAFDPTKTIPAPGTYNLVLKAYTSTPNSKELVLEQEISFIETSRTQWLIDQLRIVLMDNYISTELVPSRYYGIYKPWELQWEDIELKTYLDLALGDINNATPATMRFTLDSVPCPNLVILGGMIYALMSRGIVEVHGYYELSGTPTLKTYKGDKYKEFSSFIRDEYKHKVEEWKKSYAFYSARPQAIVLTRLPFRVIRPMSMLFGYHNLFVG
ncbi:MAG: hypothetical protein QXY76_03380 [Nitrososphaeria archaeon]